MRRIAGSRNVAIAAAMVFSAGLFKGPPAFSQAAGGGNALHAYQGTEDRELIVLGSVAGRVTFAEPLASRFSKKHDVPLRVYSGGSELALTAVRGGYADIAMVSRPLTQKERSFGLQDTLLGYDAVAVAVHHGHPLEALSMDMLQKLFIGQLRSWDQVGGPAVPVRVLLPDTTSGLRTLFLSRLGIAGVAPSWEVVPSTYDVLAALQTDSLAIGICSFTQTRYRQIRALQIEGIALERETVVSAAYPFVTTMSLVTAGAPDRRENLFFNWVVKGPASQLVEAWFAPPVGAAGRMTD